MCGNRRGHRLPHATYPNYSTGVKVVFEGQSRPEKATMFIFYETWKGKKLDAFKTLPTYSHCSLSAGTLRTNGKVRIFYQAFNILLLRSRFRSAGSVSLYISMGVVCQKSVNFLTLTVTE